MEIVNMKYTREDLEIMKARDIMKYGTALGVKGMWDMKKADAINAVLSAQEAQENDNGNDCNAEGAGEVETTAKKKKIDYVDAVEVGMLIAFKVSETKAISAKVKKRSTQNRKLLVETQYGVEYKISFDDVIWVKTGKRWPRGVYSLLKGVDNNVEAEAK